MLRKPLGIDYENHFVDGKLTKLGKVKYELCIITLNPKRRHLEADFTPEQEEALAEFINFKDFYEDLYEKRQVELGTI